MKRFTYYVYIMTNEYNTVLYVGVTNSVLKRAFEHRFGLSEGFTKKYKVKKLVYVEKFNDVNEAIRREKQLKNWKRSWKLDLIKKANPNFIDLFIET